MGRNKSRRRGDCRTDAGKGGGQQRSKEKRKEYKVGKKVVVGASKKKKRGEKTRSICGRGEIREGGRRRGGNACS